MMRVPLLRLQCTAVESRRVARRGCRALAALAPLAFSLYLAGYLVAGERILAGAWAAGEHVTLEQWAYHDLLDRLGFTSHHGGVGRGPLREATSLPERGAAFLQPAVAFHITSSAAAPPLTPEGVLYLLSAISAATFAAQRGRRLRLFSEAIPNWLSPGPSEKPPPPAR